MTMFLIGLASSAVLAQSRPSSLPTLKGIDAIAVLVEYLPTGAKTVGLTEEAIQTDVELKLRLAGIRVVTEQAIVALPGSPYLYVRVTLTDTAEAASVEVELDQDVRLERDGQHVNGVGTWRKGIVLSNPSAQGVRNEVKDFVDRFLNDWLSVNTKK